MTPERWQRLQELFAAAIELPDDERAAYLAGLAGDDAELRDELARMLGAHDPDSTWPRPAGAEAPDPMVGVTLGDYRLESLLGAGGSGAVFRARQLSKDRAVAVKVLRTAPGGARTALERFKREALAAARLSHPNLVRVHYFGRDEGRDYLVMDLVDGPNLRDRMAACRALGPDDPAPPGPDLRDPRACAALVRDLARGLQHAHAARVLHRDVKPRNVLIAPDGAPRLTDFGLAKDLELADLTQSGELSGTPQYMSPEQARAVRERIDHRTDVYSLGAVLYELLAGRAPVEGDTTAEVIHNILHRPVAPLYRGHKYVPLGLALVCMKALRRDPDKRYATMEAFADDLDRFLAGGSVHATKQNLVERAGERLVDRRVLMKLVPAAGVLGIAGGLALFQGARVVQARGLRPRVEVLVPGVAEARVSLLPLDRHHLPAGPERELGVARGGRLAPVVVPEGNARVLVRTEGGASSEHQRDFTPGTRAVIEARPRVTRDLTDGMLSVAARAGVRPYVFEMRPQGEAMERFDEPVDVAPFLIDAACVTNGEFRAYLAATGRRHLDHWSDGWKAVWDDPPREDWDALPVVDLRMEDARAYAEWMGKRLPTALEWELAAGAYDAPRWTDEASAQEWNARYVLGFPALAVWEPTGAVSTGAAYLEYAQTARGAGRATAAGFHDPFGNVAEWTETRVPTALPGAPSAAHHVASGAWHDRLEEADRATWLHVWRPGFVVESPQDTGFRCARSL